MLFFLVGPFLFFSDLRYIANDNPVSDAKSWLTVIFHESLPDTPSKTYEFPLFYTNAPVSIYGMSQEDFKNNNYTYRPETKFFDYS